jgi:Domain of unknown function (DUF6484)
MSQARCDTEPVPVYPCGPRDELVVDETLELPLSEIAAETMTRRTAASVARRADNSKHRARSRSRRKHALRPDVSTPTAGEVVVGTLAGLNDLGQPLVRHPLEPSGRIVLARTTVPTTPDLVDREVVLTFEAGNIEKPIVLGFLWRTEERVPSEPPVPRPSTGRPIAQAILDGDQVVLSAEKEIVLRCGQASLTLTRAGKVLLKGTYVVSHSSGVNRIKGGSVLIN